MQLVKQQHTKGCGVACLSMLTGYSYEYVLDFFRGVDFNEKGLYWQSMEDFLFCEGYAIATQRRYFQRTSTEQKERSPWPPKPWAKDHLCQVEMHSGNMHFVTMDKHLIYDPACDAPGVSLAVYKSVNAVAAVYDLARFR